MGAKVGARAVSLEKSTGFCLMRVTASLLFLGALLVNGWFFWHRCIFLLACIDH